MTGGRGLLLRLAVAPVVAMLVVLVAVLLPELTGVDAARTVLAARYADADPDPALLAGIRAELGLDLPLPQRIAARFGALLGGDPGTSWVSGEPVAALVGPALRVSVGIMLGAAVLSFLVGHLAGLLAARRPGSVLDRAISGLVRVFSAVPEFALAPLLVLVFAVGLHALPSSGWRGPEYAVLPLLSLVPSLAVPIAAVTREQVVALRRENFAVAARARGLGETRIWAVHLARPALPAALSLLTYNAAGAISGTTAIEVVFDIPGLGSTVVEAVRAQDVPVVQAGLVVAALAALAVGAVGDLLGLAAEPRARREART
ncbi:MULTISPECIES: ABC transporter permease [unclassified Saccharopolyspora]|uniref:ABC transporter permease n=1 Tax=unclassified Saccharopolyspora TaxID=2646250 RepID=UPI001CD7B887|nr:MULTISPECIES: ABC transporter permease [unclassified Saccharopolyspora]MCA1185292.1 ABC transporter permease [Saccharopolyspora sp. 6T]MCA1195077.1 ABC transporter permease [Saccharopolyspora sp. 6V]MCA1281844.1 ABC transporter permease [Saccharopolyspora sp. 7B]